jgi:hypothetical protein
MKDRITIEIPFMKNTPENVAAIQAIAEHINSENLKKVASKIERLGPEKLNSKLKTGLGLI